MHIGTILGSPALLVVSKYRFLFELYLVAVLVPLASKNENFI